jgi:2',3'-cyclic-nucleotide 2'-phosphodiesterase (5'-nucleotidase family)
MMKTARQILWIASFATLFAVAHAQQTREQAIAGMRKVDAKEMDPTYTSAAPAAQKLVDEALAKHPEVILLAIHATPPGHKNLIVASNFGRIGKIGDEDDMRCIRTGKSNLEVNGKHFEDEVVMKDQSGKTVGAVGVVFNYKPGDDKAALAKIAEQIRDEMQAETPNGAALFGPST